jgi:toxin YoeB
MEIAYNKQALEDRQFWINSGNKKIQNKISALIEDIKLHPFERLGKPEALKYAYPENGRERLIRVTG